MHSDVYESIWSKLGMMIDTIVLYILVLVLLFLTLIQGHRTARKQNLCVSYLRKFVNNLNGIWYTVETCWYDEPYIHFMLSTQYSRERTLRIWTLQSDSSLNDLDVYSRSQGCSKARTWAVILL